MITDIIAHDAPTLARSFDSRLVSLLRPQSFEAEQYRRLRQRIEDRAPKQGAFVLAVTSAVAGDGKTLTAINLAASLAQAPGARVLLIDADLRQPTVAQKLDIADSQSSWTTLLEKPNAGLQELAQRISPSLAVLGGGPGLGDPYEVLRSAEFSAMLSRARSWCDYVVIDTPPLVPVPDATLFDRSVDGYVVVVAAGFTPRRLLAEALNLLDPASVIGLVFNRDRHPLFGYYQSHYRGYFKAYVRSVQGVSA